MLLTQTAEYALRAMACLAQQGGDTTLRSAELAKLATIPSHYVSKVMRRLVVAGLVQSKRGHGGGFSLARKPQDITFLEILQATDHFMEEQRCAFGLGDCDLENPCPLHPAWSELRGQLKAWAMTATLDGLKDCSGTLPADIRPALS